MSDEATTRMRARLAVVPLPGVTLRRVEDGDGPSLTALIAAAYDEYQCGPLDPDEFDADLARPGTAAEARRRAWWVTVDTEGRVVGSVALGPLRPTDDGAASMELHRLYLARDVRGAGLATSLLAGVIEEARRAGATTLLAWSDTRLTDAHRRYVAMGFELTSDSRELGDPAGTTEFLFTLDLTFGGDIAPGATTAQG